ncbi:MAG: hypothetical protein ACHP7O_13820 [Burkholderiales bacterium]
MDNVLALDAHFYFVGSIVRREASSHHDILDGMISRGIITLIDPADISALQYLSLLAEHELGEGETECITFATMQEIIVATDDARARKVILSLLGKERLTGSLGLLLRCISSGRIVIQDAQNAYDEMRRAGAFLPNILLKEFIKID